MRLHDIEAALALIDLADPDVTPVSGMKEHIGRRLTSAEVEHAYARRVDEGELDPRIVRVARVFEVPKLVGRSIVCDESTFHAVLDSLLDHVVPVPRGWRTGVPSPNGPVFKYALLDGSYVAPDDDATKQAMTLDLGGMLRTPGITGHWEQTERWRSVDGDHGRFVVTITHAHWTNLSGLGIGVGFYA